MNQNKLNTSDAAMLIGVSPKAARRLLKKMREELGKEPKAPISIEEFCAYLGLPEEEVREMGK